MNQDVIATVHRLHCSGVAEEGEIYVPDLLADEDFEPGPALCDAADEHARDLREAERYIDEALHLADVLRAAMGDAGDRRAMQVDTVLKIVGEKLGQAHARIDEHDASHVNLFMAYAELKNPSAAG
jgi:hypothetical protein